jgi:ABC-type lipoprotein export system ATPase subunit
MMLEIRSAYKYFNKGKKSQVRAIDGTSIMLSDNGLVALLGPSGCGKTTLLNSIGGLDKLNKGSIYIDGKKISSRFSYKVDKIRNINIGYIFQDYKLIDKMSVYDNVAIVLKMIGIKDKKEIKTRVEYVLDKVGMLRYKRRPCGMLSGGERQRVGIARAIVKDPPIILADEPTGNLDSKNSLEIMKILQAISKDRLVVLVTHEEELARFYASRIIEIKDGKVIKDYSNSHNDELDYQLDNTFYLKDFERQDRVKDGNYDINIYSSEKDKLKLDIVVTNGNIYIRSKTIDKVEVIDEDSSIELINDHYKKIDKKDINKYNFDFKKVINNNIKKRYSSILNPISLLITGFKKVFDYSFLKKILLGGFFLSGMFLMYAVSSIGATLKIDDSDFVTINKEYLTVSSNSVKVDDYLNYEKYDDVEYILPGDSIVRFSVPFNDYYQTSKYSGSLKGSLSDINMIEEEDLILGSMPSNDYEIVVDKMGLENMFDTSETFQMAGISKIEDMLGRVVNINNMNDFKIVGVVDKDSPSIYVNKNMFINIIANSSNSDYDYYDDVDNSSSNVVDYNLYLDKIELKKGKLPSNDYEVIVSIDNQDTMPINKEIDTKINGKKLKVVGYYYSKYGYNGLLVNNNTIKYNLINNCSNITIYSSDKNGTLDSFRELKLNIKDSYSYARENYLKDTSEYRNVCLIMSLVILMISLIEIFLMMRSSFLSRVKEIGIYRAIGVKKIDIYKMFFGEIVAITTLAGVPGVIFMAYIISILCSINYMGSLMAIDLGMIIITIIFMYLFNLIVGLLPVFNTVRKKPAQILSRYDLD